MNKFPFLKNKKKKKVIGKNETHTNPISMIVFIPLQPYHPPTLFTNDLVKLTHFR